MNHNSVTTVAAGVMWLAACWTAGSLANGQSFEVASVKVPAPDSRGLRCSGGPGTATPTIWRCSNMPLGLVVSKAFGLQEFQFSAHDPCCVARFDLDVRLPAGVTQEQFRKMLQRLLEDRFKLALHFEQREMPIYELTIGPSGVKMRQSAPSTPVQSEEPWWVAPAITHDKVGYPEFPAGRSGVASGFGGRYRWVAISVSVPDIARTIENQVGRPVVDATGLRERYDFDLKWVVDNTWNLSEKARDEFQKLVGEVPEKAPGPLIFRAVRDRLGLELRSKKGVGKVVVIDHLEKVPTEN
jgi:uncharacterized protein (TIGR03435 family)